MTITSLRITDFRNLAAIDLTPSGQGLNIIYGNNGSGKTSLLEAIYYLSLGRSFRSTSAARLIRQSEQKLAIFAQLQADGIGLSAGVERQVNGQTRLKLAEREVMSVTDIAAFLPTRVINSQSHHLLESGPLFRRKFLDWGLFYQSPIFLTCWRQFERALKQRNTLLRGKRPAAEIASWTEALVKHGVLLHQLRTDYVQALEPLLIEVAQELLGATTLKVHYHAGWDEQENYATVLFNHHLEEIRSGYTLFGPHRADFDITLEGVAAKHFLSRGQQKLLICAMIVAQGMLLTRETQKRLIYLVDDLPAELDLASRAKLIAVLARQETQVFITAIESAAICRLMSDPLVAMSKVFHVEHGQLSEIFPAHNNGLSPLRHEEPLVMHIPAYQVLSS